MSKRIVIHNHLGRDSDPDFGSVSNRNDKVATIYEGERPTEWYWSPRGGAKSRKYSSRNEAIAAAKAAGYPSYELDELS